MPSGNQPNFYLAFTAKDGREYVKGPSVGMWDADKGPQARGSIKGEYLKKLIDFLVDFEDESVSVALFENDGKGSDRGRRSSRDDDRGRDRDDDRDSRRSGRSDRREEKDDFGRDERGDREERGSRREKESDDDDGFGRDDRKRTNSDSRGSRRSPARKGAAKKKTKRGRK